MQRHVQLIALNDVKHCSFDIDDLTCHLLKDHIVIVMRLV